MPNYYYGGVRGRPTRRWIATPVLVKFTMDEISPSNLDTIKICDKKDFWGNDDQENNLACICSNLTN